MPDRYPRRRPLRFSFASSLALLGLCAISCGGGAGRPPRARTPAAPDAAPLGVGEIADRIPSRIADRHAWAEAVANGLAANDLPADEESVCAVVAVITQESGFEADPVVPGLAAMVATRIDRYKAKLGPMGDPLFHFLLAGRAPEDARTFQQRLATVRTERDVDVLFRDILASYASNHPALYTAANWAGKWLEVDDLADLNPITTSGSMQVSVRFADEWAETRGHPRDGKERAARVAAVRESLYTRRGGVYYGTARLLAYPTHYARPIFRFADYNAGFYASRNAALQRQIARLTGRRLALDGDLLAYEKNGRPRDIETESMRAVKALAARFAPHLGTDQIRADLLTEKTLAFEETETYAAIKRAAASNAGGGEPEYAILPQVALISPKLARPRSTAWFAQSVDRHYQSCLGPREAR